MSDKVTQLSNPFSTGGGGSNFENQVQAAFVVTYPGKVGNALGRVEWESADAILLPKYLAENDKSLHDFIGNFIWGRFHTKGWSWVDSVVTNKWTKEEIVTFFLFLPFVKEAWQRAESLLGNHAENYWKKVGAYPSGSNEQLLEAVKKLLQHERPQAAVMCINRLLRAKATLSPEIAVNALMDSVTTREQLGALYQHSVTEIIGWLQDNPNANPDDLFRIEWAYLPILDPHSSRKPKTLERRLAVDPDFFCEVIRRVFRSDKEDGQTRQLTEQDQNIAHNAYRLLHGWRTPPGKTPDGLLDSAAFSNWLKEVANKTKVSGHFAVAMNQIGQVLPYAPQDSNGLWIHCSVAEALNRKDAGEMRSGFTCKLFNMRGVHGFSAGKEEKEIAAGYREKADALEEKGYHRFATSMREFAKGYERDAEREAQRNPFKD